MSNIKNTYDIYNQTFSIDQPIVNNILNEIYDQLAANILINVQSFDYSLTTFITPEMTMIQSNRIIDRVLCVLRDGGLRAIVKNNPLYPGPDTNLSTPYYSPWFNNVTAQLNIISISWFSRNSQEYKKTWM